MSGLLEEQKVGWVDYWKNRRLDGWINKRMEGWMGGLMEEQKVGWVDSRINEFH